MEELLERPLGDGAMMAQLRSVCGLSHEDEAAARRLLHALQQPQTAGAAATAGVHGLQAPSQPEWARRTGVAEKVHRSAAADAERLGLRRCALASCGATEAHALHFKRCTGCRAVVYCCREHQVEGWPGHKKACKAARKAAAAEDEAGPSDAA